jgi:hypothetical protein
MSQQELLKKVVLALEQTGIAYMVTGSLVSSLQGEPRSTHDIDIVINLPRAKVRSLAEAFPPPDYYLDEEALAEAVSGEEMANLIDVSSGDKVDFWMLTDEPFDRSRFARRYKEDILGIRIAVSTPEDTILMKLRWASMSGGSEKQFTDAVRVFEVQYGKLDQAYLREWGMKLGLEQDLEKLKQAANKIE